MSYDLSFFSAALCVLRVSALKQVAAPSTSFRPRNFFLVNMPKPKSSFLDKVLGRIHRLDAEGMQTVVQRLARERTFLETLFNAIEDGVLVVDAEGRILYCNQSASGLLGLPAANPEGQNIQRYLNQLDWSRLTAWDAAGGQQALRHEFEIEYPRRRFLRLYATPLGGETGTGSSGFALILHDATEARQQSLEAIESERIQALTLLAASVAHEIGNPLNALHIHLQLMERELRKLRQSLANGGGLRAVSARRSEPRGDARAREKEAGESAGRIENYLSVAKGEITRLDYIVTQFLQAIRPSQPQLRSVSLNHVVRETLELLRPELENRALVIRQMLATQLPPGPIDPAHVKQLLVNLIKNAMQAMTKGGELTLQTGESDGGVWVSVRDTGTGIAPEQINRIFEPFFTTKKKGSGLGLMIVQRIAREHGGRIEVDSKVGQGTTFRVWFPRRERKPLLLGEASPPPPPTPATNPPPVSGDEPVAPM